MAKGSATININALRVAGEPNKYITKISDGITIHDSQNQNSNYIKLTSDGMEVYKNSNMCFEASATELKASLAEAKDVFTVGYGSAIANKTETRILNSTNGVLDLTAIPFNTNFNLTFTVFFVGYSVTLGQSTTFENTKLYPSGNLPWNSAHTELWRQAAGYSGELLPSGSMSLSIGQPTPGEKQINYTITITGTGLTFDYATITAVWEESAAVKDQVFLTFGSREDGISKGLFSSAMGLKVAAIGDYSHAEGYHTIASGNYSHASGFGTQAIGDYSYSSGYGTKATIDYQTVFGKYNEEDSDAMFIIGNGANDNNRSNLMVVGDNSIRIGNLDASHLLLDYHSLQMIDKEGTPYFYVSDLRNMNGQYLVTGLTFIGDGTTTDFNLSLPSIDTNYTVSVSDSSGGDVTKYINYVHFSSAPTNGAIITIGDYYTTSDKAKAYTFGSRYDNNLGAMSCSIGMENTSSGYISYTEGYHTTASGYYSHAEGTHTIASGYSSHAEGDSTTASDSNSHAEGFHTTASGVNSHAEGQYTNATAYCSHAEGYKSTASKSWAHAEGDTTTASNYASHAEGQYTNATGDISHAEGYHTIASGRHSHAQNNYTVATGQNQTVIGRYNAATVSGSGTSADPYVYSDIGYYAFIIGNGSNNTTAGRSNALTVDWNGNVVIPNNSAYKSKNLSGDERRLCYISTTNGYIYGYDSYVNNEGSSYLYGNTIGVRSKGAISIGHSNDNNTIAITGATSITGGLNITGQYQRHGNTYIVTDTYSKDDVTVYGTNSSNNSYTTITIDIEKDGYTPIAVVGYNFQNATHSGANSSYIMCYGCTFETTNDTASVKVRNLHTANAKIKANVRVLYRAQ